MSKETEQKKFKLPVPKRYYVEFLDEILLIENSPEAYQAILPLVKRRQNITGFKPQSYPEALSLIPRLEMMNNAYENALRQFADLAKTAKCYDIREHLLEEMENLREKVIINKFGRNERLLTEDQRLICNVGKVLIEQVYPPEFGSLAATHSFWFEYLSLILPDEKIFLDRKIFFREFNRANIKKFKKPRIDPFAVYLNFHELRVKPVYSYEGELRIDIPIYNGESEEFYLGCWSPEEGPLIKEGHFKEQDCSDKKALENGRLIVDNEDNAQNEPHIDSASRK